MKELKITSIEGNTQLLDGGAMFGNAPKELWQKWVPTDPKNRIPLACRSLLVEFEDKKILCEVGVGNFFEPKLAERFGVQQPQSHLLIENLKNRNISEFDIDYVILSHLHFDHAGGLLPSFNELSTNCGQLRFPNAQYIVGKAQWERAQSPHPRDRASYIKELSTLLEESRRLTLIEGAHVPGLLEDQLSFHYSNGHTPGLMLATFKSDSKQLVFTSDLIPGTQWLHVPITMGYDRFAELVIDEKKEFYKKFDLNRLLCFYTHDPDYALSGVQLNEKGKYLAHEPLAHCQQMTL